MLIIIFTYVGISNLIYQMSVRTLMVNVSCVHIKLILKQLQ